MAVAGTSTTKEHEHEHLSGLALAHDGRDETLFVAKGNWGVIGGALGQEASSFGLGLGASCAVIKSRASVLPWCCWPTGTERLDVANCRPRRSTRRVSAIWSTLTSQTRTPLEKGLPLQLASMCSSSWASGTISSSRALTTTTTTRRARKPGDDWPTQKHTDETRRAFC